MKTVTVSIEGTSPILLHSGAGLKRQAAKRRAIPTPEEEAQAGVYWMPDKKTLGFPTYNFVRALIGGCSRVKVGKVFISSYVAGCVVPAEEMASFGTSEYNIDTRRAVVQRQGVLRSRARLDQWKLTFVLQVDETNLPDGMGIEDLQGPIREAGNRLGLGDFRPQCKGPYGRFVLTDFRVC